MSTINLDAIDKEADAGCIININAARIRMLTAEIRHLRREVQRLDEKLLRPLLPFARDMETTTHR